MINNSIKKISGFVVAYLFLNAVATITSALFPYFREELIDNAVLGNMSSIWKIFGIYFLTALIFLITTYICNIVQWKTGIGFERAVKSKLFAKIAALKNDEYKKKKVGEYISMQSNDVTAMEQDYLTPLIALISSIISVVINSIIVVMVVDYRIAFIIIVLSLIFTFIPELFESGLSKARGNYSALQAKYTTKVTEFYEAHSLVTKDTYKQIKNKHESVLDETAKARYKYGKKKSFAIVVNGSGYYFINLAVFIMAGVLFVREELTAGAVIAAFGYVECFCDPFEQILYCRTTMSATKEIKKKLEIYDTIEEKDLYRINDSEINIEIKNMCFEMDSCKLSNVNYTFESGKKYVLTGNSGTGKTTLLRIIAGEIECNKGGVFINGRNVRELEMSDAVFFVRQEDYIFSEDFVQNVSIYGTYKLPEAEELEENMHYIIVNKCFDCTLLSGGEKKIISFLRGKGSGKRILLLDEPFSATDKELTKELQNILLRMEDTTIILVTHNLNEELRRFDDILEITNGCIVSIK